MPGGHEPSRGILDPVARKLRLPFATPEFIDRILTGSVDEAGRRTLFMLITTWDMANGGPFAGTAIATMGLSKTVDNVQKLFVGPIFDPLLKRMGADQIRFRASLGTSQLVGLGILRYAVRTEPIHSMKVQPLVDAVAPTLQRYLIGDIG
jgi:hypothetical protein